MPRLTASRVQNRARLRPCPCSVRSASQRSSDRSSQHRGDEKQREQQLGAGVGVETDQADAEEFDRPLRTDQVDQPKNSS